MNAPTVTSLLEGTGQGLKFPYPHADDDNGYSTMDTNDNDDLTDDNVNGIVTETQMDKTKNDQRVKNKGKSGRTKKKRFNKNDRNKKYQRKVLSNDNKECQHVPETGAEVQRETGEVCRDYNVHSNTSVTNENTSATNEEQLTNRNDTEMSRSIPMSKSNSSQVNVASDEREPVFTADSDHQLERRCVPEVPCIQYNETTNQTTGRGRHEKIKHKKNKFNKNDRNKKYSRKTSSNFETTPLANDSVSRPTHFQQNVDSSLCQLEVDNQCNDTSTLY